MSNEIFPSNPEPGRYKAGSIEDLECVFDLHEKTFTPIPAGFKIITRGENIVGIRCASRGDAKLFWMRVPTNVRTSIKIHPLEKQKDSSQKTAVA